MKSNFVYRYAFIYFTILIFIFCLMFFCKVHPLIPYDADDWFFLAKNRIALPLWGSWNPTRIFPEVLEPTCALFGTYFISPFTETWVDSQIIANGILASIFITTYVGLFERLLEAKTRCRRSTCFALSLLFLTLHFLVFRVDSSNNTYMFRSNDVASFYVYVLSNLLCASIVMYIILFNAFDTFFKKEKYCRKSLFVLAMYFALFSNIFASAIIATYTAVTLVQKLPTLSRQTEKGSLRLLSKGVFLRIAVLSVWVLALLFELNGGRSDQIGSDDNIATQILLTIKTLFDIRLNISYMLIVLIPLLIFAIQLILTRVIPRNRVCRAPGKELMRNSIPPNSCLILNLIICGLLCLLFIIVVCAKAETSYISRADVLFSCFFFFTLGSAIALGNIISKVPAGAIGVPLVLVVTLTMCNTTFRTFKETNTDNLPPRTCIEITNNIVTQLRESSNENNSDIIDLHVPQSQKTNNWPFPSYSGDTISTAAYKLGLIDKKITINIVPDQSINDKYDIYQ